MDGLIFVSYFFDFIFTQNLLPQLFLLYTVYLLIKSKNIFYSLLYVFIQLLFLGIFIAFYQMEFYTGFLWVAEFSVVLVFLILLIYLNTDGYVKYNYLLTNVKFYSYVILFFVVFFSIKTQIFNLPIDFLFDYVSLWDDYYEALNNTLVNDFNGLFTSFYVLNSFEFLLFGLLLLFGTFLCVGLYKTIFTAKIIPYSRFFSIFNFFNLKINYNFIRQQNLHTQTLTPAVNRVIKKK